MSKVDKGLHVTVDECQLLLYVTRYTCKDGSVTEGGRL